MADKGFFSRFKVMFLALGLIALCFFGLALVRKTTVRTSNDEGARRAIDARVEEAQKASAAAMSDLATKAVGGDKKSEAVASTPVAEAARQEQPRERKAESGENMLVRELRIVKNPRHTGRFADLVHEPSAMEPELCQEKTYDKMGTLAPSYRVVPMQECHGGVK